MHACNRFVDTPWQLEAADIPGNWLLTGCLAPREIYGNGG